MPPLSNYRKIGEVVMSLLLDLIAVSMTSIIPTLRKGEAFP